jgi:hypothetical protein
MAGDSAQLGASACKHNIISICVDKSQSDQQKRQGEKKKL